jgi:hypothetical protein
MSPKSRYNSEEQLFFFEEEKRKAIVLFLVMDVKYKEDVWLRGKRN